MTDKFKVGDVVRIKNEFLKNRYLEGHNPIFTINSITDCLSRNSGCGECPGNVNGDCYGYNIGYALELNEWDTEKNR